MMESVNSRYKGGHRLKNELVPPFDSLDAPGVILVSKLFP